MKIIQRIKETIEDYKDVYHLIKFIFKDISEVKEVKRPSDETLH